MTLALWSFFWDEADWSGGAPEPEPIPTAEPEQGRGSGKNRKHQNYTQADDVFWEMREQYLRAMHAPLPVTEYQSTVTTKALPQTSSTSQLSTQATTFILPALPRYESEKSALLDLAKLATSTDQLRSYALRLIELNKAIQQAKAKRAQQRKRKLAQLTALGKALIELLR